MIARTNLLLRAQKGRLAPWSLSRSTKSYVAPLLIYLLMIAGPAGGASAGPAVGQFELKDLDAEYGEVELQSQNAFFSGLPGRRVAETTPGEYAFDENTAQRRRNALEIEMTLTSFFRLRFGIEYEKERFDDVELPAAANLFDEFKLSEVAVEGVVILVPVKGDGIGFGMLTEYESPLDADEQKTIIFGPIFEVHQGQFSAILNLTLTHFFGGGDRHDPDFVPDNKWDFSYATQLKYQLSSSLAFAIEAYGTIDRLGNTGRRSEAATLFGDDDQHRIGPLIYYSFQFGDAPASGKGADFDGPGERNAGAAVALADDDRDAPTATLGLGVLFGLNASTSDTVLKASLEVEF